MKDARIFNTREEVNVKAPNAKYKPIALCHVGAVPCERIELLTLIRLQVFTDLPELAGSHAKHV